jgi:hypothetical protein
MTNTAPEQLVTLADFPTTRIVSADSATDVPCEPVAPGIAITPYLDLGESEPRLGGGFTITHTASGRGFVSSQACLECARVAGRRLASTGVDWLAIDPTDAGTVKASVGEDKYEAVVDALRLFQRCHQRMCWHDEDAATEAMTAR